MPPKYRHECERCGLVAEIERAGRFRDEDFQEVLHELFDEQREHQLTICALWGARAARDRFKAQRDALEAKLHWLANRELDLELENEGCPF